MHVPLRIDADSDMSHNEQCAKMAEEERRLKEQTPPFFWLSSFSYANLRISPITSNFELCVLYGGQLSADLLNC